MPSWNEQQLKAIHTKDKNILVSASAGSGKTTVLIARLMDLVMVDHVSIDQILAMTFTEAAANEMKKRLAVELQAAYKTSTNDEEKKYITKQLTNIQNAHISTIHSFCLSIIQDYYYIIGLDPERIGNIMDNGAMVMAQQEALDDAFQKQYQRNDDAFLALTQMFSARSESNDALSNMVRSLASIASSQPNPTTWLSSLSLAYKKIARIEDLPNEILENFFEYLYVQEQRYEEALYQLQALYRLKYDSEVKKAALVETKIQALPSLQTALSKRDYLEYRTAFINICHGATPPSPDKEDKEYAKIRKQIVDIEDSQLEILFSEQEFLNDIAYQAIYVEKLVELCLDYRNRYASIKEEIKSIDFDDMEHFALEILQAKNHIIADIYREQFVEIMVDEFQDSNDVQNELVMLICKENNVFRVGDIKQSIYGFRHAKPQLMKGLIDNKGIFDDVIYLSNNYRSKKMIVDFNNDLFKLLMNIDGFSCSYSKEDDVETGIPPQLENNVPICFHAVYYDQIKEREKLFLSKNAFKASYIANQIIAIKDSEQRSWKDFVVLVRGNARKDDMKAIFDELHIPYFIDIKYGFYQSNAVQIMLSTLKAIYRPHEDISFVATLMSPLFQVTTQDLAIAKLNKDKKQSYYSYFQEHPFDNFTIFQDLVNLVNNESLTSILNSLFEINSFYSNHTTIQEKTNLDLLFEKAVQFEEDNATGIAAFLSKIEQIKGAQTAEAIPIGSEADVVRVMSIHQSKGLQFPVVFLWSTDKQTPIEFKDFCICDSELGLGMKCMDLPERYVRTTIQRIAMEHKKDKEELEEEMRILYVATTRAQQQMHIVDCIQSLDAYRYPLSMSSIYNRKGYTSWILQAFLQNRSPLFQIKEVNILWNTPIQERIKTPFKALSQYQNPTKSLRLSTATIQKDTQEFTPFQIDDEQKAMSYGTMMHEMIEHLEGVNWTKDTIVACANNNAYTLRDSDVHTLYQLGQNEQYKEAMQGITYHELPFMAKENDEILHGYMDFVSFHNEKITIVDFKTDYVENEKELIDRYHEQLAIYKKAMLILYPKAEVHCSIYSLHFNKMITV